MNDLTVSSIVIPSQNRNAGEEWRKENFEYNLDLSWSVENDFLAIHLAMWNGKVPSFHLRSMVSRTNIIDKVIIYLPGLDGRKKYMMDKSPVKMIRTIIFLFN